MSAPLSVFLITRNEAARLPRTLAALKGLADQVVVVDSGSTDDTLAIARAAGAETHHRDWTGYGAQKRHAEDLCRHAWRLNVDADEIVTPALAEEIRALLASDPAPAAYRAKILNLYPGRDRPRPLANDYDVVRLYHRDAGRYRDHPLFDRVETTGPVKRLRAPIHHVPFLDWAGLVAKENAYSSFQAEAAKPRPMWKLRARLLVEFPFVFLKGYFARGHVLGGWDGLIFATVIAFARWLRIAKMIEAAKARKRRGA
ncbi:Glycosyltransferase involved in cell wall bisynthesis [Albimonas donghaensis]|uniref:Glycosyltransferase involved in cell wall bisynthesis n=1 Tax=Albimonas donghaensis TaxID=356660 RepID=A0A1H2TD05_9RHOB|nr:glycosyltransferase family 2 protein [Albimonas donghaensis]SDW41738.1 Glycosyltransferase involved in cell wall bisynthesis [Albimonas donghaensis]